MSDLLNKIYLPETKKKDLLNSNSYRILKDNGQDPSILEGYENNTGVNQIEFPVFNTQNDKNRFAEDNAKAAATSAKEYLETFGNFLTNETEDFLTSLQLAAINGADVATNLMPLAYKMLSNAPLAMAMPPEFFSPQTEKEVMRVSKHFSENLGEYRKHLHEKQKDNGWVKDILSLVVQDSAYSIPAYTYMRKAGIPKYPAFFLSAAIGAIGVENEDRDGDKTYFAPFAKDLAKLKELIGILPNTPEDKIADEVHQALEYGTFGVAIPGIIDAFKFMKRYLPSFTTVSGTTGAVVGMTADNEAEGFPIKSILKAVDNAPMFKSSVLDTAEKKIPAVSSGDQIFNTIKNSEGVKHSELMWMDLEGFLKGKKKVSKDEVLEFINNNRIDVSEVKLSADAPVTLPKALRNNIEEYETRWRDSDLADGAAPNYDVYKIKSYGLNNTNEQIFAHDWQSVSRNPLIDAMDNDAQIVGQGVNWNNIKARLIPWEDMNTGKYTGHVIEVKGKDLKGFPQDDYHYVSTGKFDDSNKMAERYLVSSNSLDELGEKYKFKKIVTYEIDSLELERFHLEDSIRDFKLSGAAGSNAPVYGGSNYTMPGGEEYTELVFKTKTKDLTTPAILEGEFGTLAGNKVKSTQKTSVDFMSPHFGQPNEFAHVRFKTRYLENGNKLLVVEEMQSDLLQASKTQMFMSANNTQTGFARIEDKVLKDFPFKNTWYEFTIKRLSKYAVDNGFDAIAIPKGSLAANRYGQEIKNLKKIEIRPMEINKARKKGDEAGYILSLFDEQGKMYKTKSIFGVPGDDGFFEGMKKLEKDVGSNNFAEIQSLVLQADDTQNVVTKVFDKAEVTGSGVGKFNLYDKTIPSYMKKYAKKWNAKVYDDIISTDLNRLDMEFKKIKDMPVTVLELSDKMKSDIASSSQPLFSYFGGVTLSSWGAKEISDSIENNSISQTTN